MGFIKTVRSRGKGDILINLNHVQDLRPVSGKDRRTVVTFAQYDDGADTKTVTVEAIYDDIATDYGHFEGTVLPAP